MPTVFSPPDDKVMRTGKRVCPECGGKIRKANYDLTNWRKYRCMNRTEVHGYTEFWQVKCDCKCHKRNAIYCSSCMGTHKQAGEPEEVL